MLKFKYYKNSNIFIDNLGPTRDNNVPRPTNNFPNATNSQPLNNGMYCY